MAHWTIAVTGIAGPAQLETVFAACARLGVDVHSARFSAGRVRLELAPGAPLQQLEAELLRLGFETLAEPGDHSMEGASPPRAAGGGSPPPPRHTAPETR